MPKPVHRKCMTSAGMFLLLFACEAAHAGPVKSGVNLWVDTSAFNSVTILSNGTPDFPGNVGNVNIGIPYEGGWGCDGGSIDWKDTNNTLTLRMRCNGEGVGLDVFNSGGFLEDQNSSFGGDVELTAGIAVGTDLRNRYGFGKSAYTDRIFTNGSRTFDIEGCVGIGRPDMDIFGTPVVSDTTLTEGQQFTIDAVVKNVGNGTCQGTTLRYFLSEDFGIDNLDMELRTVAVGALGSNESFIDEGSDTAMFAAPPYGVWWVGACVDSAIGELITANNCSPGVQIFVGDCRTRSYSDDTVAGTQTVQACGELNAGPSLTVPGGQGLYLYGGTGVRLVNGVLVEPGSTLSVGTCNHNLCDTSTEPLNPICMPCVSDICTEDPLCCGADGGTWDFICVSLVADVCDLPCPPTP